MKTYGILIGNSDDKLSQRIWSQLVNETGALVLQFCEQIHFHGCSDSSCRWQNAAWMFTATPKKSAALKKLLARHREGFLQESAVWIACSPKFI